MEKTRYVVLTEKRLRKYGPCVAGLDFALQYLPAAISTDPEENSELAVRLHEEEPYIGIASVSHWVDWLKCIAVPQLRDDASTSTSDYDPYQTAQQLAMIADYLAR